MENEFVNVLEEMLSGSTESKDQVVSYVEPKYEEIVNKANAYDNLYDKYLRQMAEYDNFRKRTLKEKDDLRQMGHQKAIETILPLVDDFERALENISEEAQEGVKLIYNKFINALNSLNVTPIVIENNVTVFNDDEHEAISMLNVTDENLHNKVMSCVQKGYKLNGKVIRHAKVIVNNMTN